MLVSKTLIIVTTRFLQENKVDHSGTPEYLFHNDPSGKVEILPKKGIPNLNHFFGGTSPHGLFKVKDELVFGFYNLERDTGNPDYRLSFVKAMIKDVVSYINREAKGALDLIKNIKLFLHRKELGEVETNYLSVKNPEILQIIQDEFKKYTIEYVDNELSAKEKKNYITAEFIAYKHGGDNPISDILSNFPWEQLKDGKSITSIILHETSQHSLTYFQRRENQLIGASESISFNCPEPRYSLDIKVLYNENGLTLDSPDKFLPYGELCAKLQKKLSQTAGEDKSDRNLRIILANTTSFASDQAGNLIVQHIMQEENNPIPTIVISPLDIMWDWEASIAEIESRANKLSKRIESFEQSNSISQERLALLKNRLKILHVRLEEGVSEKLQQLQLDMRYRFFDSSIWYHYISLEESYNGGGFQEQLNSVLKDIDRAYQLKLYWKDAAKEYFELNNRLFGQSRLEGFGSHSSAIVPFRFHSESQMERRAENLIQKFKKIGLKWDFLLIDDFAERPMRDRSGSRDGKDEEESQELPKQQIIKDLIDTDAEEKTRIFGKWSCVTELEEGISFLKSPDTARGQVQFDVILLDYLFSADKHGNEKKRPDYGTRLLKEIKIDIQQFSENRGPIGSFWIFPVTVFTDALASAMQEQNIPYTGEHYYVARGADPINTPQLFRCNLFEFLNLQLDKILFNEKDVLSFFLQNPIPDDIYRPVNAKIWAKKNFGAFLQKFSNFDALRGQSSFARRIRSILKLDSGQHEPILPITLAKCISIIMHNLTHVSGDIIGKNSIEHSYIRLHQELMSIKLENKEQILEQVLKLGEHIFAAHNENSPVERKKTNDS